MQKSSLPLHHPLGLQEGDWGKAGRSRARCARWQAPHHVSWGAVEEKGQAVPGELSYDQTNVTLVP